VTIHQSWLTKSFLWEKISGAAVCILETYTKSMGEAQVRNDGESDRDVRGLARMVQVSTDTTLIDLTLRGVSAGNYRATIREYGDLKDGATSTGPVWSGQTTSTQGLGARLRGVLGTISVDEDGRGAVFDNHPFQIWEVIGHAMVITLQEENPDSSLKNDENTVVGVIARSAGMWDNDKTVCSCTGKTLWEERKDEVKKGML
jgi:copper chaperone for superoxide dismutase